MLSQKAVERIIKVKGGRENLREIIFASWNVENYRTLKTDRGRENFCEVVHGGGSLHLNREDYVNYTKDYRPSDFMPARAESPYRAYVIKELYEQIVKYGGIRIGEEELRRKLNRELFVDCIGWWMVRD